MKRFTAVAVMMGVAAILSTRALAQTTAPANNESQFSLTVYSTADPATFDPQELARRKVAYPWQQPPRLPGYGVVRETRPIRLVRGVSTLRFTDVASGIDPTTVAFESLGATVIEQNYEYDLVNFDALLAKYLSRQITITRDGRTFTATLLSSEGSAIIYREGASEDGPVQVMSRDPGAIQLPDIQRLNTKPTLVWKLDSFDTRIQPATVTYQTDGLTWRADYSVVISQDESRANIGAWVTLLNQSGASYPNAKLKLVAGDVQRIRPEERDRTVAAEKSMVSDARAEAGFEEKSFFEYHLYTLGRPTSLLDNSTKQIELFPSRKDVPMGKTYVYYGLPSDLRYSMFSSPVTDQNLGLETNKKVDVYLTTKNTEANGMGMPLPAGRIRVYKQDPADQRVEFVGEDVIQHTPKDEPVMIRLGSAFDILGERTQTDFKLDYGARWITESFQIKLRNHKQQPVDVLIKENLLRALNWEITANSEKFGKEDFRTIHFPVNVPAGGEKVMNYTVKYTW
jgi:hypothetical protein